MQKNRTDAKNRTDEKKRIRFLPVRMNKALGSFKATVSDQALRRSEDEIF
jgi:hypothetical protein